MINEIKNFELERKQLIAGITNDIDHLKTTLISRIAEIPDADFERLSEFVSAKKASKLLGVSMPTLHRYSERGILKRYWLGNKTYYRRKQLAAAIKS